MLSSAGAVPRARHPKEHEYISSSIEMGAKVILTEELIHSNDLQEEPRAGRAGNGVGLVPFAPREQQPRSASRLDQALGKLEPFRPVAASREDLRGGATPKPLIVTPRSRAGSGTDTTHVDESNRDRGRQRRIVMASFPGGACRYKQVFGFCTERVRDA